jgi:hypothetical protein
MLLGSLVFIHILQFYCEPHCAGGMKGKVIVTGTVLIVFVYCETLTA